ncbi:Myosin-I heavy chain (Class VII unconventional myosin) (DdMVII) (DdM7) [Durusdinium trenchii]|uniref:Myosin-I heavy chain (Class VII unconventional myosin) (DdMVII) (DdM7) n=1 Tax=Durusdinium trenchii TaxID=1381693 RepID=A0ABP0IQ67_9DINO
MKFQKGSFVFVPDDDDMYVPAEVESEFESGKAGAVKLVENGARVKLSSSQTKDVLPMDEQSLDPTADMVHLRQLDEASILYNLRLRYMQDEIYTNIGTILVSVNPFKVLPIYSPEVVDKYVREGGRNLGPHVFGVADNAYRSLTEFGKSQSCIVSGESGAGKTEATKLFLQYIGEKSSGSGSGSRAAKSSVLQEQILEANPLMEAFGNAKTVRNDNSSRFGKLIEVQMDNKRGNIVGGSITQYLLEKSRLVQQAENERNYHVFYQICAAASMDPAMNAKFELVEADQYFYLNQSKGKAATMVPGLNDAHEWENTVTAMEVLGMSAEQREDIVRTLAGILHLGNVRFSGSEDKSSVENAEMLNLAADQLGTSPATLEQAMCRRNRGNAKEAVFSDQGVTQARDSRDALAKAIYSNMFDWLIDQVNACLAKSIKTKTEALSTIGVLDIFGFESFDHNSYEQLCINYCNEKLQSHFNAHIFTLEQDVYKKEGLDVSKIDPPDNSAVLKVLEAKGKGIFAVLDEENRLPRGSDEGFLSKVLANADGDVLSKPDVKATRKDKGARSTFVVMHYAGSVVYDADGFLEKNKDLLLTDLHALAAGSSFKFLASLFRQSSSAANKKTIGAQFKAQLKTLMDTLDRTEPHYIRCIKPNSSKAPNSFRAKMCMDQLKYSGLLEVCKIRKNGYPVRKPFAEFVQRYRPLAPNAASSHTSLAKQLERDGILAKDEWQIGKTQVFLRTEQFNDLEVAREDAVGSRVATMQRVARGFIARRRFQKYKKFLADLAKAMAKRDAANLEKVLLNAGVLPYQGRYLAVVQEAKQLVDKLHEEERVKEMLERAIKASDKSAIESALNAAKGMKLKGDIVSKAEKALKTIQKQAEVVTKLRTAVEKRDVKQLAAAIKAAKDLKMQDNALFKDAVALRSKIEEEEGAIKKLAAAVKAKNVQKIKDLLPQMAELGLEDLPLVKEAQTLSKEKVVTRSEAAMARMHQIRLRLEQAIDSLNLPALESLSIQAIEINLQGPAVEEANRLRAELAGKAEYVSRITAAMKAIEIRAQSYEGLVKADLAPLSEAIQLAVDNGFQPEEEELQEAIEFEERMNKQIAVQDAVDKALKSKKPAEMRSVMAQVQQVGLKTGPAQKLKGEISALDAPKSSAQLEAAKKERLANRRQLREASEEDKLKDALMRIIKVRSEEHAARLKEASDNTLYDFSRFYKIRSDEDFTEFASGEMKLQYAQYKLKCQSKPIPKSLLELDEDLSRTAIQNHKAILQYCGELSNSFPTAMAGYVLVRGQEMPELCDEIYMQLMKQLTENRRPVSEDRAWALMCMCTRAFPPSGELEPFLINFLVNRRTEPGLIGNFARLCLVQLDRTLQIGPSEFLPDMEAIENYSARPAVLAEITKQDGEVMSIPVAPDQDVGYVLEICNHNSDVPEDEQQMYSIFVIDGKQRSHMDLQTRLTRFYKRWNPSKLPYVDYFVSNWTGNEESLFQTLEKKYGPEPSMDEDVDSPAAVFGTMRRNRRRKAESRSFLRLPVTAARTAAKLLGIGADPATPAPSPESAWPLPWWAFLGDIYIRMVKQGREPVFSHKRMIIFPDEAMTDNLFQQVREEVRDGELPFSDTKTMAMLVTLDLKIQNGGKKIGKFKGKSMQDAIVEILPSNQAKKISPPEWEQHVLDVQANEDLPRNVAKLQGRYFDICKSNPLFGMTFYYAQPYQLDEPVILGVNLDGVHILDENREKITFTYDFANIQKYGASGTYFWMLLVVEEGGKVSSDTIYYRTVTPWSLYSTVYTVTHVAASKG